MAMMKIDEILEIRNRKKAGVITFILCALIFLILVISSFKTKEIEDPLDGGVMVSLGEPNSGGPDQNQSSSQQSYAAASNNNEQEMVTTNQQDAHSVKATDQKKTPTNQNTPTPPTPKVDDDLSNELNKLKNRDKNKNSGNNQTNSPNGEKDGNPDGDPDGNSKTGKNGIGKSGLGISGSLAGSSRKVSYTPPLEDTYQSKGKVVVEVLVSKTGKVLLANAPAKGTTANDPKLIEIAKKMAQKITFEPEPAGGPESRTGTITFDFTLK